MPDRASGDHGQKKGRVSAKAFKVGRGSELTKDKIRKKGTFAGRRKGNARSKRKGQEIPRRPRAKLDELAKKPGNSHLRKEQIGEILLTGGTGTQKGDRGLFSQRVPRKWGKEKQ